DTTPKKPAELLLIKDQYELAFHALSRGLTAEEAGKRVEALKYYTKGQLHLTRGLDVPTWGQKRVGPAWDTARQLQKRMRGTLGTVNAHLSDLQPPHSSLQRLYPSLPHTTQNSSPTRNTATAPQRQALSAAASGTIAMATPGDQPPAYTPQPTDGHRSLAYGPAGGSLRSGTTAAAAAAGGDGNELLFIPSGVQMFFVAPNGEVSSLSYPGFLRITTCKHQKKDSSAQRPSAFLQVCDQLYPLTADTPVLLANSGIYMFPDSLGETTGSYVGLVLSSELPATDREMFQDLLAQLVDLRIQGPEEAGGEVINLTKILLSTFVGSTRLSQKLSKGAEATGRAIQKGGGKIREHITPEETPSVVSPRVTRGLQATQQATGGAVRVSRFLVNGLSTVVGHVAEKMAPHVKKHGAKLVPESMKKNQDGRASNLNGAKFVAISSVQGLSAVWSSLETGAKLVAKGVATETVTTVKHKYGDEAGQATDTALMSVANVGVAAYNLDHLASLAVLNAAEKGASKNTVKSPDGQPIKTDRKTVQKKEEDKKK
uniref:MIT domain-containing protein n=1 Tax=Anabas testudineus TaxID=64144 RepID=A0A3Q1H8M7_ANATE